MPESAQATIARIAQAEGIDPAYALAVAERESNFNPNAGGKGSIRGLYQMSGQIRREQGLSDKASVEDQTRAFARHTKAMRGEMAGAMGRQPTWDETYAGHYWGGNRAGRVISGAHSGLAPSDVFSARELADNPELAKGASMGALAKRVTGDIAQRRARFGANASPTDEAGFAGFGQPEQAQGISVTKTPSAAVVPDKPTRDAGTPDRTRNGVDFAQFGSAGGKGVQVAGPDSAVDFSQFGMGNDDPRLKNFERNKAWTKPGAGNFNTDLADREPQFRQWVKDNKVPFDPDATGPQDYDMRGFYQGMLRGHPAAKSAVNQNDGKLHYPDNWKTPYHESFSADSQWATPDAPKWNPQDQLVAPDGAVIFDERAKNKPQSDARPGTEVDLSRYGQPMTPMPQPVTAFAPPGGM